MISVSCQREPPRAYGRWVPREKTGRRAAYIAGGALTLIILGGCSQTKAPPQIEIPEFETIAVQAKESSSESLPLRSGTDSIDQAAKTGATVGAAGGAAAMLACAPLGPLCLAAPLAGATYGYWGGAALGAARDTLRKFPPEIADQFEQKLRETEVNRNLTGAMRDAVASHLAGFIQAEADQAQGVFHVGPDAIILIRDSESQLALGMTASMLAEWDRHKGWPMVTHRWYSYKTAARPIEEWVHSDGEAIDAAFTECIEEIAAMVAADVNESKSLTSPASGSP